MDFFLFLIIKLILIIWYMYKLNDKTARYLVMGNRHVHALGYTPQTFQAEMCLGEMQCICACRSVRFSGKPRPPLSALLMDRFICNSFLLPLNISGSCMMDTGIVSFVCGQAS